MTERQYSETEVQAIRAAALREAADAMRPELRSLLSRGQAVATILAMIDQPDDTALNALIGAAYLDAADSFPGVELPAPIRADIKDAILDSVPADALAALERVKQAERERLIEIANNKKSGFYEGGIDEWEQGFCAAIDTMIAAIRGESE